MISGRPRIVMRPRMTHEIVNLGLLAADPLLFLDVGASGGIEHHWRSFGASLRAIGFDPLVRECERLNRDESSKSVRYVDGFVGVDRPDDQIAKPVNVYREAPWDPQLYARSSSFAAMEILRTVPRSRYNSGNPDMRVSERHFSLDTFLDDEGIGSVDFMKIDTDGYDFEVLTGARQTLSTRNVLGLFVECQFHGAVHAHANLFSNIDTVLRGRGFSLCDLEINRYTRRALPGKFRGNLAAETIRGQVLWADALYLRDYVAAGNADRWGVLSTEKILKLACLFELYGLFDCSAELLIGCRGEMPDGLPVDGWLDILAEELRPGCGGFARLSRQFEKNPELAYPSKAESAPRSTRWLSQVFRRLARGS